MRWMESSFHLKTGTLTLTHQGKIFHIVYNIVSIISNIIIYNTSHTHIITLYLISPLSYHSIISGYVSQVHQAKHEHPPPYYLVEQGLSSAGWVGERKRCLVRLRV